MNDILLAKIASILKCLKRVQEDFENENTFRTYITKQDAVVLNLQRACEAPIDIANHIVKEKRLGLPKSARESFELLSKNGLIQAPFLEPPAFKPFQVDLTSSFSRRLNYQH